MCAASTHGHKTGVRRGTWGRPAHQEHVENVPADGRLAPPVEIQLVGGQDRVAYASAWDVSDGGRAWA
jgi:hypothetical protein